MNISVEELLKSFGASPEPSVLELPNGMTLKFKRLESYGAVTRFNRDAAEFVKTLSNPKLLGPAWAEFLPLETEEAVAAYTIHTMCVEPGFTQLEAVQLMKAPWLVAEIMAHLNANRMNYLNEKLERDIEAGKAESGQTEPSVSDCPSVANTCQEGTPTN